MTTGGRHPSHSGNERYSSAYCRAGRGARRFCYVTAFRSPGIRGVISLQRSRPQAFTPLRPTCAATGDLTGRKQSSNTRCCISSVIWWVFLMHWALNTRRLPVTIGARPVAWHAALLRPDRFRAVVGLSVPYRPRTSVIPTSAMPRRDDAMFYQLYFQTPGVAEAELERDVRKTLAKVLYAASGDAPRRPAQRQRRGDGVARGRLSSRLPVPDVLPVWLSEADSSSMSASSPAPDFGAA